MGAADNLNQPVQKPKSSEGQLENQRPHESPHQGGPNFDDVMKGVQDLSKLVGKGLGDAQHAVENTFGALQITNSDSQTSADLSQKKIPRGALLYRLGENSAKNDGLPTLGLLDQNGVNHGDKMPTLGLLDQANQNQTDRVPTLGLLNNEVPQQRLDAGYITDESQRNPVASYMGYQPVQTYVASPEQVNEIKNQTLMDGFKQFARLFTGDDKGDASPLQGFKFKSHIRDFNRGPFES